MKTSIVLRLKYSFNPLYFRGYSIETLLKEHPDTCVGMQN